MTLVESLLGGIAVVIVIFFLLRLARLPIYWCGVISGLIPTLAYIVYSLRQWPGGDIAAMHLALFGVTAIALSLFNREGGEKRRFHWIPLVLIGAFIVLFAVDAAFLIISSRGLPPRLAQLIFPHPKGDAVHTAFPGVVPHGEDAGKAVNQYLSRSARQEALGWQVRVSGLERVEERRAATVTVNASDKNGQPIEHARVELQLLRPAKAAADRVVGFETLGQGRYVAHVEVDHPGRWVAVLQLTRGADTFEWQQPLEVAAP